MVTPAKAPAPAKKPTGRGSEEGVLARFIRISSSAINARTSGEAANSVVNQISELLPVDRAVLVDLHARTPIAAVSGGGQSEQGSVFADAVREARRRFRKERRARAIPREKDADSSKPRGHLARVQAAMQGTELVWLPLSLPEGKSGRSADHVLWLERWGGRGWAPEELELLNHIAPFLALALRGKPRKAKSPKRHYVIAGLLTLAVASLFVPVESSVVAPATVVADKPYHVFAPLEGVVQEIVVEPGQNVAEGELLFRYDPRLLDRQLEESHQALASARAELARLEGAAFSDSQSRAQLPVQELEVEKAEAELAFQRRQRERADVKAAVAGVVVLDDPEALLGAPLQVGEMVMGIADPHRTKLRLMVPASDAGLIGEGNAVEVRLDRDPLHGIGASVTRLGFDVRLSEAKVPSVLTEARWRGEAGAIQPGQKGSAKVYGEPTSLGLQLFRKPLITLRRITGW